MSGPVLSFWLDVHVDGAGTARLRLVRPDRLVDYGELSLTELRYVIEALLPRTL